MRILLLLLFPIMLYSQRDYDTLYQSVYIYKTIYYHKMGHNVWLYGGYDKDYGDEIGIGLTFGIYKRKKVKKYANKN